MPACAIIGIPATAYTTHMLCANFDAGAILCYGATDSGKTYTMMGGGGQEGMIPMAIRDVFLHVNEVIFLPQPSG